MRRKPALVLVDSLVLCESSAENGVLFVICHMVHSTISVLGNLGALDSEIAVACQDNGRGVCFKGDLFVGFDHHSVRCSMDPGQLRPDGYIQIQSPGRIG